MNVPKLRFKEFDWEWKGSTFGELFEVKSGYAFKLKDYVSNGINLINGESIQHNYIQTNNMNFLPNDFLIKYQDFKLVKDDIVLGLNRPIISGNLKIARVTKELDNSLLYQRAGKIIFKSDDLCRDFFYIFLSKEIYDFANKESVGSDQPFISTTKLNKWKFTYPENLAEQKKIGDFFEKLSKKIQLQQQKIDLLKEQKKGYMQKVFKQEIRFKDEDGRDYKSWIYKPLSKIADKISKKNRDLVVTNVISNSASKGLISQIEYFEKDIANKENIGGYYVISTDDFVYNPRISSEAPYGPVNIYNNKADGIVSPLYTCFRLKDSNKKFIYYYFKSSLWHKYVYTNGDSGARHDRVSIKDSTFFEMPIALPSLEEQEKIASFLSKLDEKIQLEQQKLTALEEQKKGFMQQMFV
ncbi:MULTISPECIES: restriction endonuclease subunit S [Bacillus cereus group]|uniref:restriction endonuclease subunit S n=1 Tax=Bacillus cereus group TaxID=86661 RepID=UPI00124C8250|nr:restriction endonuclease subunit S [Bacillus cereus]KAB2420324.1 restriction endonuclease subunit S [Bacillus cereus]